jgi:hypothetical protein
MEEDKSKFKQKRNDYIIVIIIIVVLSIGFLWYWSNTTIIKRAEVEDLELTISSEKEIINDTLDKSFVVNIVLANVVDDNLFIYHDFSINGILEFSITTPSNNLIYPVHPHINFTEKVYYANTTLYKSESINTTVDIFNYEYSFEQGEDDSELYDWNEIGKYKIQFEYYNYNSKYEIIKSNTIEFEII